MSTQAVAADIAGIAAIAATVTGVVGTSANVPETIPATPWAIVGNHHATFAAGANERIDYTFPVRFYVERVASDAQTSTVINGLIDAMMVAFRTGMTLGGIVDGLYITDWNSDLYAEVGGSRYQVLEANVHVIGRGAGDYTA